MGKSKSMKIAKNLLASLSLLMIASSGNASTIYDFTIPGTGATGIGSGFGNALDFGDLTVTAWATTGLPSQSNNLIDNSQILRYGTGLGACNKQEGTNCGSPQHQVDNVGDDDLILFVFDQQLQFNNIVIDPYGIRDRDVSFWVADINNTDLTNLDPDTLIDGTSIFGTGTFERHGRSSAPLTINLGGNTGNALLFSAYLNIENDPYFKKYYDRFKIASLEITSIVPVPAAAWLFGSGILGLVAVARRRDKLKS